MTANIFWLRLEVFVLMLSPMIGLADAPDRSALIAQHSFHDQPTAEELNPADLALLELGRQLRQSGYRFTTVTPATHRRVLSRAAGPATLRDVFGWSRGFHHDDLPDDLLRQLEAAGVLKARGGELRSAVRFSSLGDRLFVHSSFPTDESDAVFFGPDTYRFARAIAQCARSLPVRRGMRILDVGAGSGAGGLHAAALLSGLAPDIVLSDINRRALRFSRVNAALNGVPQAQVVESDLYAHVEGPFDLIISNPPYLVDPMQRTYRHGGGAFGAELSIAIAEQGIARLAPSGRLLLYTGSAIVDGVDLLHQALRERLEGRAVRLTYEEIDPDVFGEELDHPPYDCADRIAVVVATLKVM